MRKAEIILQNKPSTIVKLEDICGNTESVQKMFNNKIEGLPSLKGLDANLGDDQARKSNEIHSVANMDASCLSEEEINKVRKETQHLYDGSVKLTKKIPLLIALIAIGLCLICMRHKNSPTLANGAITGKVFNDANGNGKFDNSERAIAGVVVYIDANNNGVLDPEEASTTTNESGDYKFNGLSVGNYVVRQVLPNSFTHSPPSKAVNYVKLTENNMKAEQNFGDEAVVTSQDRRKTITLQDFPFTSVS